MAGRRTPLMDIRNLLRHLQATASPLDALPLGSRQTE
jgi:hypothetical protein